MKRLALLILILLLVAISPVSAFASEPVDSGKRITVEDSIMKLIFGDDEYTPVEKATFYGLRHICDEFNYEVEWDSSQGYAVVTKGEGKVLTDGNGNSINALVILPGVTLIELHDGDVGKLDELPVEYKAFIENGRLYVHSSVFENYFGLKTVD